MVENDETVFEFGGQDVLLAELSIKILQEIRVYPRCGKKDKGVGVPSKAKSKGRKKLPFSVPWF
jgi:hypothetical protein